MLTTPLMLIGLAVLCCLGFLLTAGGCTSDICSRGSDCANGLICSLQGQCMKPPIDAPSAGSTDAGAAASADATPAADAAVDGGP